MTTTNPMAASDENSVHINTEGFETTDVEISTPAEAAPAPQAPAEKIERAASAAPSDEGEHEEYSASVQKRIDRLTRKMREAERQREEALRYATTVKSEADQMRSRMQHLNAGYLSEHESRLALEQRQAEALLKHAVSVSDADLTVEAQRKLSELAVARDRFQTAKSNYEQNKEQAAQQARPPAAAQPAAQQAPQPAAPRRPDPKAEAWASKNAWFGKDEAMTFAAFGIHKRLVEDEGFDPQSDDYYSELDQRMAREFPHKIQRSPQPETQVRPAQTVAGVSRNNPASGGASRARKVRLTPSQVAIAKRLGVPLEEYAKYVKE